jgi:hypothetical protein
MARDENQFAPVVRQRVVEREARTLHARQAVEPLLDLPVERRQFARRVRRGRAVQRHQDPSRHLVAKVLVLELVEAARQHRRAGDEHYRQRGLDDEQRLARERRVVAGAAARAAERIDGIRPRCEPGRRHAEEDACDEREEERKAEHRQRRARADRQEVGVRERQIEQQLRRAHGDDETGDTAGHRKQHALDERLGDDLAP